MLLHAAAAVRPDSAVGALAGRLAARPFTLHAAPCCVLMPGCARKRKSGFPLCDSVGAFVRAPGCCSR